MYPFFIEYPTPNLTFPELFLLTTEIIQKEMVGRDMVG